MSAEIRLRAAILPGKRIEITVPELPESGTVELVIYPPETTEPSANASPAFPYPAALMAEYRTLVNTELNGTMTSEEAARLQVIKDQINAIDLQRPRPDVWEFQAQKLRDELAQIRAEVEALPNA